MTHADRVSIDARAGTPSLKGGYAYQVPRSRMIQSRSAAERVEREPLKLDISLPTSGEPAEQKT